jgi:hypothetical protein
MIHCRVRRAREDDSDAKMTPDEARELITEAMNYAAYRETDCSLYDSDKNCLFGSEHYVSGRIVVRPSPWEAGDFEKKMAILLRWADGLNRSVPVFREAQALLQSEDSVLGRIIRQVRS